MERRRSPRVDFIVIAKSIIKNNGYQGSIENFSREGMLKVIQNGQVIKMLPGTTIGVSFQTPSGETLNLECEVKWIRHHPDMPYGIKHHIGMEIKNPPQKYKEFVEGLYSIHLSAPLARNQN
ncbi:MAG: PilZ domain-containing protein [Candidatus Hodarchaeales archaeon]